MNEILVKRSNLDSAAKISDCDRITSTPTQYPGTTSPNPLTLHEQNVDINLNFYPNVRSKKDLTLMNAILGNLTIKVEA